MVLDLLLTPLVEMLSFHDSAHMSAGICEYASLFNGRRACFQKRANGCAADMWLVRLCGAVAAHPRRIAA